MTNPKIALTAQDKTAAAFAAVSKRVDKLGVNLGALKTLSAGALGALAIPISAVGLIGLTNSARESIASIKDLAEVSGSSVENISALDRIARVTGGTFDQVSGTLIKFNQVLKDADPDKGAGAVLKALNLDIEELKRLDPAEALRRTAVALEGFADNGDKARAYQELFGKSVKETVPFLKDLAEQSKLQGKVSGDAADEVDKFNKQLSLLQANADDAGRAMAVDLITEINSVIERFKEGQKEGKNFLQIMFASDADLKAKFARMNGGTPARAGASRFASGIITNEGDQSLAELAKLARGAPPRLSLNLPEEKKDKKEKGSSPKDPTTEAQRYLEALQRQLEGTQDLTEVEQALRDLQLGRLGKVSDAQRQSILNIAAEIDAAKEFEEIQKEFEKLDEEAIDRKEALAEAGRRVFEETRTPLEQFNNDLAELQVLLDAGAISLDTFARKSSQLGEALKAPKKELSELDKFAERAAQNIQDALGDELTNILEGDFDNIGASFTKMLNRMVAESIAADLARSLGFGSGGGGGSGGNVITSLLGAATGALFGTSGTAALASAAPGNSLDNFLALNNNFKSIPSFDVGTDYVPKDMLALVHKGEKITPASQNVPGARGATMQVTQNFTVGNNVDRRTQLQIAAEAQRGLAAAQRNL